jgi:peroxiredoxin
MALQVGQPAPAFEAKDQKDQTVAVPGGNKVVLSFLRHLGCPLCQMKLEDLIRHYPAYAAAGVGLIAVVQSVPGHVKKFAERKRVPFSMLSDVERKLYQLYQVPVGGIKEYMAPPVLKATLQATLHGHMHGRFEGHELQIPADFVIGPDGVLSLAHYGQDISDFLGHEALLAALQGG